MFKRRSYWFVSFLFALVATPLTSAAAETATAASDATPLRVDINADGRADMRTIGWENWQPSGEIMSQSFGDVTVTLRAGGDSGSIRLVGDKAIVIHGVTLGAD